jgi:excinuclease UvrABC ATPase subunit
MYWYSSRNTGFNTITAQYLNGKMKLEIPAKRREENGKFMKLTGATGNNLRTFQSICLWDN